jgi:chromosome segregation ATPase
MTKRTIEQIQQMIRNAEEARKSATTLINTTQKEIDDLASEKLKLETKLAEDKKKKEESKKAVQDNWEITKAAANDGISQAQTTDDAIKHAKTLWSALKNTVVSATENAGEIFSLSDAEYHLSQDIPEKESELKIKMQEAHSALNNANQDMKIALRKKKHLENQEKLQDLEKQVVTLSEDKATAEKKVEELTSEAQKTKELEQHNVALEQELQESIATRNTELSAQSEEISKLNEQIISIYKQVEEVKANKEDLDNQLKELALELESRLDLEQENLELLHTLEESQKASETKISELTSKLESELQKEAELEQKIQDALSEKEAVETQLAETKEALASEIEKEKDLEQKLEASAKSSEEEVAALKAKLEAELQKEEELEQQLVDAKDSLASELVKEQALEKDNLELAQKLEATAKASEEEVAALKAKLEAEVQKEEELAQKLESVREQLGQSADKREEIMSKYIASQESNYSLSHNNAQLSSQVSALEEQLAKNALVQATVDEQPEASAIVN